MRHARTYQAPEGLAALSADDRDDPLPGDRNPPADTDAWTAFGEGPGSGPR